MNKIFVLGSINMDFVFSIDRIPKLGETIKSKDFLMTPGGKGANQAVACSKQGVKTFMLGSVGSDSLSILCKNSLQYYGVDCTFLDETEDLSVGVAGIFVEEQDNRIVTYSGANSIHDIDLINEILEKNAEKNDYLLSQLEIPMEIVEQTFKKAKSLSITTILNLAPAQLITNQLLSLTDILVLNETEIETLTKIIPNDETKIKQASNILLKQGAKSILLTLGDKGSIYIDNNELIKMNAFAVEAVDTTAAGDTYIGAFVSQLINKKSIKQAMEFASAAAALTIQQLGAQSSIPSKDMVEHFMKKNKEKDSL